MAARPPQRQTDTTSVEFGIAALIPLLEEHNLRFPLSTERLIEQLNDPEIPVDASGQTVSLSTVLAETTQSEFESQQELLNTLHPIFEQHRQNASSSLIGSIRRLIPF